MRTLVFILMLVVIADAQVRPPTPKNKRHSEAAIIISGNQLYDLCQHYKNDGLKGELAVGCFMYISGATQTLVINDDTDATMTPPCPGSGVTQDQITAVVIKWMDDHPEKRDLPAPAVVMKALNEAFPCN